MVSDGRKWPAKRVTERSARIRRICSVMLALLTVEVASWLRRNDISAKKVIERIIETYVLTLSQHKISPDNAPYIIPGISVAQ